MAFILIIDTQVELRGQLVRALEQAGHRARAVGTVSEAASDHRLQHSRSAGDRRNLDRRFEREPGAAGSSPRREDADDDRQSGPDHRVRWSGPTVLIEAVPDRSVSATGAEIIGVSFSLGDS
jgi:hypothetical protein